MLYCAHGSLCHAGLSIGDMRDGDREFQLSGRLRDPRAGDDLLRRTLALFARKSLVERPVAGLAQPGGVLRRKAIAHAHHLEQPCQFGGRAGGLRLREGRCCHQRQADSQSGNGNEVETDHLRCLE